MGRRYEVCVCLGGEVMGFFKALVVGGILIGLSYAVGMFESTITQYLPWLPTGITYYVFGLIPISLSLSTILFWLGIGIIGLSILRLILL